MPSDGQVDNGVTTWGVIHPHNTDERATHCAKGKEEVTERQTLPIGIHFLELMSRIWRRGRSGELVGV